MSMKDDIPSLFEQLVRFPGQRVLIMTKMSNKDKLAFYKYVVSREGALYKEVATELEEEPIIQHFINGTLTEEMLEPKKVRLTSKETEEIDSIASLVAERKKQRGSLAYRLYRKIVPYQDKKLK
jgi:hypothetical protein